MVSQCLLHCDSLSLAWTNTLTYYIIHTFRISNVFDNTCPRGLYHTTFYGCNIFRRSISQCVCYCQSLFTGLYKHTSLRSYEINMAIIAPGAIFTTLHFLFNLRIGQVSQSVTSHMTGKACQGQTLSLNVRKLRRK